MEQSVNSNSINRFKAIASTAHASPIFQSFLKKEFSENPVNLGLGIWFYYTSSFNFLQIF